MFPDGAAVTQSSEASQPTAAADSQSSGTVSQAEQDNQVNDSLNETMDVTMQSGKFGRISSNIWRGFVRCKHWQCFTMFQVIPERCLHSGVTWNIVNHCQYLQTAIWKWFKLYDSGFVFVSNPFCRGYHKMLTVDQKFRWNFLYASLIFPVLWYGACPHGQARCNMAFIVPMHRNKPNITYLLTYSWASCHVSIFKFGCIVRETYCSNSRPVFYLWLSKVLANERRLYICNVLNSLVS